MASEHQIPRDRETKNRHNRTRYDAGDLLEKNEPIYLRCVATSGSSFQSSFLNHKSYERWINLLELC